MGRKNKSLVWNGHKKSSAEEDGRQAVSECRNISVNNQPENKCRLARVFANLLL